MRLINGDALHTAIAIYMAGNAYLNDTALDVLKMIAGWVEATRTIEAEPVRHGRWMDKSMDYYCSACGTQFHDDMFWIQGDCITPNYCPNCGAKMDGKEADHGL